MYKSLRYLKVNGAYVNKGEVVDLSHLTKGEIARLVKKGIVQLVDGDTSSEIEVTIPVEEVEKDHDVEMTEDEVREELLKKITHAVAVKELKILGAEFKANASLEKLVEIIMKNEAYEDHFLDYIEMNEL